MAITSGQDGHVKNGTFELAEMTSWNLQLNGNELPANVFGTGWNKTQQGIKSWNISLNGFYDYTDTNGQVAIQQAFFANTLLSGIRVYVNDTSYWAPDITLDSSSGARVTAFNPTNDAGGLLQFTCTLSGSGPVTFV